MSESLRGRRSEEMTQLKSPRIKRFLEEERMEGEKKLVLLSVGEKQIGEAYILRNESEEEPFREMLIST